MKIIQKIKDSIRYQLVGSVVVILAVVVTFVLLYYPARQKSISKEAAKHQVESLSGMLSFSVGMGLGESNFELVQTTFKWAQKDKNVSLIHIQDESNSEIVSYNPKKLKVDKVTMDDPDTILETNDYLKTEDNLFSSGGLSQPTFGCGYRINDSIVLKGQYAYQGSNIYGMFDVDRNDYLLAASVSF